MSSARSPSPWMPPSLGRSRHCFATRDSWARSATTTGTWRPSRRSRRSSTPSLLGKVTHVLAESYGPVVLKPQGSTWRSQKSEGGGALYDYAAHPLNLLNWYFGEVTRTGGTDLGQIFSRQTDDEVYSNLWFADGTHGHLSVNWSDESQRKMTTKVSIWGTQGRLYADRQEVQALPSREPSGDPGDRGYDTRLERALHDGPHRRPSTSTSGARSTPRSSTPGSSGSSWARSRATNDFASAAATDQRDRGVAPRRGRGCRDAGPLRQRRPGAGTGTQPGGHAGERRRR